MNNRVTVAVVAFDPVSHAGITSQLRYRHEVSLVGDPQPGAVALVVVDQLDEQASTAIRAAVRQGCARVVVVAAQLRETDLLTAVEGGCCGVLRRGEATPDRLVAAVRAAAAGDGTLAPDLLGRLLEQVGRIQREALAPRQLTPTGLSCREAEVLRLVADGRPTVEIAKRLSYSERTVKNILHDLTTKWQLRTRAQAVAYAVREGFI